MAREISVNGNVSLRKGNLSDNIPFAFSLDMVTDNPKGPTPGAVTVPTAGVEINLTQLITPGVCIITNLDDTNYFEVGIREPENGRFYMLLEIGPGESWALKFSRNLLEEFAGPGTGTSAPTNQLWAMANGAACNGVFRCYEK